MSPRSIAAVAAFVVGLLTLARATSCDAGGELFIGSALCGVLAAIWNDNPERGVGARIAKLLLVVFMVGLPVFFFTLILNSSRCS